MKIYTYSQIESILRTAFDLVGNNIKTVAEKARLNLSSLYKWNSGAMRFSPENIDKLILYFQEHEPTRLDHAVKIFDALQALD